MRNVRVWTGDCCSSNCGKVLIDNTVITHIQYYEKPYYDWLNAKMGTDDEKKKEWIAKFAAIKKALDTALHDNLITKEEYEKAMQDWLTENPNPYPEEEPNHDVTEEFEKLRKRVAVPVTRE